MTLYELTGQFLELLNMAEDGELDPEVLNDTMEAVGMEIEDKADGYAKIIKTLEAEVNGLNSEIERLEGRKQVAKHNIERLKKSLEESMIATGKTKFKTALFGFNIQKNAPSLDAVDEDHVPAEFRIPQPDKLDRKAILAFLKENGNTDWASMKQTESLRIR